MALRSELLYDYERSYGREAARQQLDRAVSLYRRQRDEELEGDLRRIEQRLRPALPASKEAQPALAAAPAAAQEGRAQEQRDRARRAFDALLPNGAPDRKKLSTAKLCRDVLKWLEGHDSTKPLPHPSTIARAVGRRR